MNFPAQSSLISNLKSRATRKVTTTQKTVKNTEENNEVEDTSKINEQE